MKEISFRPRNFIFYAIGAILISFGVVFMLRSEIGLSTWDTLHYSLHKLTGMKIGDATIWVALVFTVMVIAFNKNIKYIFMAIPIFVVGTLINYINLDLLANLVVDGLIQSVFYFTVGLLFLPLGGSLLIISTFPAGVFDEFTLTMMKVFRTNNLIKVRVIMEISAVTLAIILSQIANAGFGMFNIGTLISALSVGFILKQYLTIFEKLGLYNNKEKSDR